MIVWKEKEAPMSAGKARLIKAAQRGMTMVEIAMVLGMIAIFSAFALTMMQGNGETRDARMVQAAQAKLQAIISQASVRLDMSPMELTQGPNAQNVLNALRVAVNDVSGNGDQGVRFRLNGSNFQISITSSGRGAQYQVTQTGDVQLVNGSLVNFTSYGVQDGVIHKL